MKKINKSNIAQYINFLHIKKRGLPADKSILELWQKVPVENIETELNNLYNSWENDSKDIQKWQEEFFNKIKQREKTKVILLNSFLFFALFVTLIYYFINKDDNRKYSSTFSSNHLESVQPSLGIANSSFSNLNPNTLEEIGDNIDEQINELERLKQEKEELEKINKKLKEENKKIETNNSTSSKSEYINDELNKEVISTLLNAEVNQNAYYIKNCFASQVKQYWDMKNISNEKLIKHYQGVWNKIEEISYENLKFSKLSTNKYKVTGTFSFYSIVERKYKSRYFTNIYIFNDNNQIVSAYSL